MLIAVLLSLMPLAPPAEVRQEPAPAEPFLQWDGETEDAYRRALHLWAVRGKPGEAADILLKLADTPEVTQLAGQASWVLVLAAQALAEAGRADEARALIPGIERGARGSELESFVQRELVSLRSQVGSESAGVDAAFRNYFKEVLQTPDAVTLTRKYGRSLLPYILDLLDSWQLDAKESFLVIRAVEWGWEIADEQYVDALIERASRMSTLSYLTIFEDGRVAGDVKARKASLRFWLTQSASNDEKRARSAINVLVQYVLKIDEHTDDVIITTALEAYPESLQIVVDSLGIPHGEAGRRILWRIVREGPPDLARAAGTALSRFGFSDVAELAGSGALTDVARYLAFVARASLPNWGLPGGGSSDSVIDEFAASCLVGKLYVNQRADRRNQEVLQVPPVPGWKHALDVPEPLLANESLRSLLAHAAVGLNDSSALDRALAPGPPLRPDSLMLQIAKLGGPLCESIWKEWPFYAHLSRSQDLDDLIHSNPNEVTPERVRLISSACPDFQSWHRLFVRWSESGRVEDLRAVLLDAQLPPSVRGSAAMPYRQASDTIDPLILATLMTSQPSSESNSLIGIIIGMYSNAPEQLEEKHWSAVLELFYQKHSQCFLVPYVLRQESSRAWKPVLSFISDRERALWIQGQISAVSKAPSASALALEILRRGVIDPSLLTISEDDKQWIQPGSAEAVEACRILLNAPSSAARLAVLQFLLLDAAAYSELQPDLAPLWSDPVLAGWRAYLAAKHARLLDPTERLLEVWELPGLSDRSLVLRAMINTTNPRFVPVLLAAISDPDPKVAAAAREGLQRLKELEEQRAFWESWQATGVGGSPTAALLKQIQSKNKEVRLSAIRALGAIQAPEALPLLISLLEDPDPEVVEAARAGLSWLKQEVAPK